VAHLQRSARHATFIVGGRAAPLDLSRHHPGHPLRYSRPARHGARAQLLLSSVAVLALTACDDRARLTDEALARSSSDSVPKAPAHAWPDSLLPDLSRCVVRERPAPRDSAARADSLPRADSQVAVAPPRAADSARARDSSTSPAPPPAPAPLPNSILPGCRIVAYYGNPLSRRMGILGEIAPDSMLARLARQAEAYEKADSLVPVIPALQLITPVAQKGPGPGGLYRARMPDTLIQRVAGWAESKRYLFILDVQVGHSNVAAELKPLLPYLKQPHVHLALDPEFSMKGTRPPGTVIGTMDATDINAAVDILADLVETNGLPPKVLIIHRFTNRMLTNHRRIKLDPRVQVVIDMDGFGPPWMKLDSYEAYVAKQPVQYTGFKLFYKNDKPLMTPADVLKLVPVPLYVMYQ
jgi:hypothetical protein